MIRTRGNLAGISWWRSRAERTQVSPRATKTASRRTADRSSRPAERRSSRTTRMGPIRSVRRASPSRRS